MFLSYVSEVASPVFFLHLQAVSQLILLVGHPVIILVFEVAAVLVHLYFA